MRRWLALLAGVAVLGAVNWTIVARERLLRDGRVVLLELAPVDPRSLMQGDYMALRFRVAGAALSGVSEAVPADGRLVLAVGADDVGTFRRIDTGAALAADEVHLRYRIRDGEPKLATNAFFFEEGQQQRYAKARYGEFRVAPDGEAILTALRDGERQPLGAANRP